MKNSPYNWKLQRKPILPCRLLDTKKWTSKSQKQYAQKNMMKTKKHTILLWLDYFCAREFNKPSSDKNSSEIGDCS